MGLAGLLFASWALASDRRLVVVAGPPSDPVVTRMRDELRLLGLEVEVVPAAEGRDLAWLSQRRGAAAAARVEPSPPEVVLWVAAGRGPGEAPGEIRVIANAGGSSEPGLLALRAVELLRGQLLDVPARAPGLDAGGAGPPLPTASALAPPPASAPTAPSPWPAAPLPTLARPPAAPPSARPERPAAPEPDPRLRPRRFALLTAPAILASPGGVPSSFGFRLGAQIDPFARLGFEAMIFAPVTASSVTEKQGSADLRVLAFGGGARASLTPLGSAVVASLGAGVGAVFLHYAGEGAAPAMGASGSTWAAAPYADVAVGYRLDPRFALRADLFAALLRPEPVIRVNGQDAASFGQPAVLGSIGVEVRP